jgi:hypothetical protein
VTSSTLSTGRDWSRTVLARQGALRFWSGTVTAVEAIVARTTTARRMEPRRAARRRCCLTPVGAAASSWLFYANPTVVLCGRLPSLMAAFPAAVGIWTFISTRTSRLLMGCTACRQPTQAVSRGRTRQTVRLSSGVARTAILCRQPPAGQRPRSQDAVIESVTRGARGLPRGKIAVSPNARLAERRRRALGP